MRQLLYFAIILFAISCSKEDYSNIGPTEVHIETHIQETATKAVVTGTTLKTGNTIGIFVYLTENEDGTMHMFTPYGDRYKNVRAYYANANPNRWEYRFEGSTTFFENIFLIEPAITTNTEKITLHSYAPWIDGCTSIENIPVTVGGEYKSIKDIMWAQENSTPSNSFKPTGDDHTVHFTYRHALSLMKIGLKCKHDVSEMKLTSITIKKSDGGSTPLYKSGTMNGVYGTFNSFSETDKTDKVTVDYSKDNYKFTMDGISAPFLIFPVDNYSSDGDYIIEFTFNNQTIAASYPIKRSDIMVNGEAAFKQGCSYTFNFTLDNYMQIDKVSVNIDNEWIDNEHELLF